MAKALADMSNGDIEQYMALMGKATDSVMPSDGLFCLVVFDSNQKAHYVSNCNRLSIPAALRELADQLEAQMAKTN